MNNIQQARQLGQQIWLDSLSRSMIIKGQLGDKIRQGISGITTNPAIFLNAIKTDPSYQENIRQLKQQGKTDKEIYEELATTDVKAACDIFLMEYQYSNGNAGFVSIEVDPALANDTEATVAEAIRLNKKIARPNVMIKIPATSAGIEAIKILANQCNINATLIFSHDTVEKIEQAFYAGLPSQKNRIVASVFLSRIDTAIDPMLPFELQGKTALSMAKSIYEKMQSHVIPQNVIDNWCVLNDDENALANEDNHHHKHHCCGECDNDEHHHCCGECDEDEYQQYRQAAQRLPDSPLFTLLWASTATKNPNYSDTLYIDNLIGENTINTLPQKALDAFIEHGNVQKINCDNANDTLDKISQYADIKAITDELQTKGLQQFQEAFAEILTFIDNFE
ncbi:MAG: transaldolase [Neisseriaceae bacterium]|nr:transaldolase [Neisseriaceae bacterium]